MLAETFSKFSTRLVSNQLNKLEVGQQVATLWLKVGYRLYVHPKTTNSAKILLAKAIKPAVSILYL